MAPCRQCHGETRHPPPHGRPRGPLHARLHAGARGPGHLARDRAPFGVRESEPRLPPGPARGQADGHGAPRRVDRGLRRYGPPGPAPRRRSGAARRDPSVSRTARGGDGHLDRHPHQRRTARLCARPERHADRDRKAEAAPVAPSARRVDRRRPHPRERRDRHLRHQRGRRDGGQPSRSPQASPMGGLSDGGGRRGVCTALAWGMFPYFELSNLIMAYLLGVVVVATRTGLAPPSWPPS